MVPRQIIYPGELRLDTLFNNRYFIVSQVGTGGFGSVYKARDIHNDGRLVALKQVRLQGLSPQAVIEATTTFEREVSVLSQLDHPYLPSLYEYFQTPEHWYLVMEFIAGKTLEEYLDNAPNKHLLLSEVLDM